MSDPTDAVYRGLLCKILTLPETVSDTDLVAACEAQPTRLAIRMAGLTAESEELERAAKVAAQNGMYESGAALRNRAAGIRRALEVLTSETP